jgi:DNA ligase-1
MAKKENLQLAHTYKEQDITGWWFSEKLDGMRFFWDGGLTTGMPKADVPWANTDKDERYKVAPISTGLWSRYMNVIHAPATWIAELPDMPLDGELWMGYEYRQDLMSIVKQLNPVPSEWANIHGYVFDMPPFDVLFPEHMDWIRARGERCMRPAKMRYRLCYKFLKARDLGPRMRLIEQRPIQNLDEHLDYVVNMGGEGLMLRNPNRFYECRRSHHLLKVKPCEADEGTAVGTIAGNGKYLGMMGALILDYKGLRLEMSGFTDLERRLTEETWAFENPGETCPPEVYARDFPIGTVITFKYRGKSKDGVPQEARYWRKR